MNATELFHAPGDCVEFNEGRIGGPPNVCRGVIESIDSRGWARIKGDDGHYYEHDLCALTKRPNLTIKYTEEDLKHWWVAKCPECGWEGLSRDADGGRAIADTGDYDDVICPVCIHNEEGKWQGKSVVVEDVTPRNQN